MADQEDGCYPRINGGMLQSLQYNGLIVSAVGKIVGPNTLLTADGTNITLDAEQAADPLVVNPDQPVEIIGCVEDATTVTVFITRALSADMCLETYNKMISIQQSPQFSQYFQAAVQPTN